PEDGSAPGRRAPGRFAEGADDAVAPDEPAVLGARNARRWRESRMPAPSAADRPLFRRGRGHFRWGAVRFCQWNEPRIGPFAGIKRRRVVLRSRPPLRGGAVRRTGWKRVLSGPAEFRPAALLPLHRLRISDCARGVSQAEAKDRRNKSSLRS